jgi:hypothetical protein
MGNPPVPPNNPVNLHIEGSVQNLNYGSNIGGDQTAGVSSYQKQMTKHSAVYWLLHLAVAMIAAAIWEGRHWLLHFLK